MPRKTMPSALMMRAARQHDGEHEAERHEREVVRRRKLLGELRQRRRGDGDRYVATQPAKNEPIAAMASAGPARPWRAIW